MKVQQTDRSRCVAVDYLWFAKARSSQGCPQRMVYVFLLYSRRSDRIVAKTGLLKKVATDSIGEGIISFCVCSPG